MITVEIKGISFKNKGAELMLYAIQHEFAKRKVAARFVVEPMGDYQRRCQFGLWQKTRYIKRRINWLFFFAFLPRSLRLQLGLINQQEIDVVLDASGFSYGEQWSPLVAKYRLANTIASLKQQGAKVILMPQALGPFESPEHKKYFGQILNMANKVFARDELSYAYAHDLLNSNEQNKVLEQCCDFTNLLTGLPDANFVSELHQVCFIPNSKMLEMRKDGEAYIEFSVALIQNVLKHSGKPFILIHEEESDRALANEILKRLEAPIPVLDPQDALKIKWIIGQSKVIVCSRFHGLVSALSQGVPALATGWSHKYETLLKDYEMGDSLFEVTSDTERANAHLNLLLTDASFYTQVVDKLKLHSARHKKRVQKAWDDIFEIIST